MAATVGQKGIKNLRKGAQSGSNRVLLTMKAIAPGDRKSERRAIRTAIKTGIRTYHPDLSAKKVRNRAAKQTRAVMKKTK